MSDFLFVAFWPISDVDRPLSALIAQASIDLDAEAEAAGGRIVGDPAWTVVENRLICRAPARLLRDDELPLFGRPGEPLAQGLVVQILRLIREGLTDSAIAKRVGVSRKTVVRYRQIDLADAA